MVVLNALRHQRKNHLAIACSLLAAFRCSTPCGINGKTTRAANRFLMRLKRVLNALRHQRKNHWTRARYVLPRRRVLNALRHQRKNHSNGIDFRSPSNVCSTPCGINGKTTREDDGQGDREKVLNALRHQRKNHDRSSNEGWVSIMCSTPCGINGKTTFCGAVFLVVLLFSAQRLAASTEKPLG